MSARFLAVTLLLSLLWYGCHWHIIALSSAGVALRIVSFSFFGAAVGKILGMFVYRSKS